MHSVPDSLVLYRIFWITCVLYSRHFIDIYDTLAPSDHECCSLYLTVVSTVLYCKHGALHDNSVRTLYALSFIRIIDAAAS